MAKVGTSNGGYTDICVVDGDHRVYLQINGLSWYPRLLPDEAVHLAKSLMKSSGRVRRQVEPKA